MSDQPTLQYYRYRISRDPKRLIAWFSDNWSHNRGLRIASYFGGFAVVMLLLAGALVLRGIDETEGIRAAGRG